MAIRHIALFRWNGEATPEKVDRIRDALALLPGRIPELRAYTFGPDLGITEGTYDYGVAADVDDEAGLAAYRDHPDHQAALALIRPLLADRASVQIALPDRG